MAIIKLASFLDDNLQSSVPTCIRESNIREKNFLDGLQNARVLLKGLERSIEKTNRYEESLLGCRAAHAHPHDMWWSSDKSDDTLATDCKKPYTDTTRCHIDLSESWSTMSIVCLQYQYDELSKRYEALLQSFHESSSVANERHATIATLRKRVRETCAQLAHAHNTLLSVGEKYLALLDKKKILKRKYEKRVERLKAIVRGMMAMCEHARLELDNRLVRFMENVGHAPHAQLLAEIRRCNILYLENLRLKAQIEKVTPS